MKVTRWFSELLGIRRLRRLDRGVTGETSVKADAAVDVDGLAGNEAAVVADQKQTSRGDLVDGALPAERNAGRIRHAAVIPFGVVPPSVDAAGRNDIGADVLSGIFGGERPRYPDQPHLRCRDMHASAAAAKGSVTGEEQDAAELILDHRRDDRLRQIDGTVEDHTPDMLPIMHRDLGERLVRPDRGIVDQDVDSAEL